MTTATYDHAVAAARRPLQGQGRDDRELVRLATLAASSHNTQPWRFQCGEDAILIRPDRTRRCPVVDPDDAHLYRSLGCAAENLVHAATLQQHRADVSFDESLDAVVVALMPDAGLEPSALAAALTSRQCTRTSYDGRPVPDEQLAELRAAGSSDRVQCLIRTDAPDIEAIGTLIDEGNRHQLTDRAFRAELVRWLRFNPASALRHRDGLAGKVNGQPPLPGVLGRLLVPVVIRAEPQVRTDRARLRSSAGVAAFVAETHTKDDWVEAGRAYERFALRADLAGIRTAFINQPIEVPGLRPRLQAVLGTQAHPQLLVRFGYGDHSPYSLRRSIDEVIEA
jgi:hypothetical protein